MILSVIRYYIFASLISYFISFSVGVGYYCDSVGGELSPSPLLRMIHVFLWTALNHLDPTTALCAREVEHNLERLIE